MRSQQPSKIGFVASEEVVGGCHDFLILFSPTFAEQMQPFGGRLRSHPHLGGGWNNILGAGFEACQKACGRWQVVKKIHVMLSPRPLTIIWSTSTASAAGTSSQTDESIYQQKMRGIPSTEGLSTEGSKRNSIIFGHRKKKTKLLTSAFNSFVGTI